MRLLAHLLVLDITRTEPRYDGKSSLPQLSYYNEFLLLPLDIRLRNEGWLLETYQVSQNGLWKVSVLNDRTADSISP